MKLLLVVLFAVVSVCASEITPQLVPATGTDIITTTIRVYQLTLHNKSASTVYCSVLDKQGTPRPLFGDGANTTVGSIAAGTLYVFSFPQGYYMTDGVTWSCSSATAVVGSITYGAI